MNLSKMVRVLGLVCTIASIGLFVHEPSFPTPDKLVIFLTFVFMMFGQAVELLKRFLPFAGLLVVYESFRGIVPHLNTHVNYMWMPGVDKLLPGHEMPTIILQGWLWHGHVQWYDYILYITYMLHFVLPFALAIVVWKLRESHYWRYAATYMVVSFLGFFTFLMFPAAPPWMASDKGMIAHVTRVSSEVWYTLGVHDFPSVYNKIAPNPVAAVPSLHAAYATIFALFAFTLFKKTKWKYLSLLYPLFIYFGTVYQGEHYAIDEVLGAVYGVAAYFIAPYVLSGVRRLADLLRPAGQSVLRFITRPWYTAKH